MSLVSALRAFRQLSETDLAAIKLAGAKSAEEIKVEMEQLVEKLKHAESRCAVQQDEDACMDAANALDTLDVYNEALALKGVRRRRRRQSTTSTARSSGSSTR
jgi:hypothetical protein